MLKYTVCTLVSPPVMLIVVQMEVLDHAHLASKCNETKLLCLQSISRSLSIMADPHVGWSITYEDYLLSPSIRRNLLPQLDCTSIALLAQASRALWYAHTWDEGRSTRLQFYVSYASAPFVRYCPSTAGLHAVSLPGVRKEFCNIRVGKDLANDALVACTLAAHDAAQPLRNCVSHLHHRALASAVHTAAMHNALHALGSLLNAGFPSGKHEDALLLVAIRIGARYKHTSVLQLAEQHCSPYGNALVHLYDSLSDSVPLFLETLKIPVMADKSGRLVDAFNWVWRRTDLSKVPDFELHMAIGMSLLHSDDVSTAKQVVETMMRHVDADAQAVQDAAAAGSPELVRWLIRDKRMPVDTSAFTEAQLRGNAQVLQVLNEHSPRI